MTDALIAIMFFGGVLGAFLMMCRERGMEKFKDIRTYVSGHQASIGLWILFGMAGLISLRWGGLELFGWSPDVVVNPGTAFFAGVSVGALVRTLHKQKKDTK